MSDTKGLIIWILLGVAAAAAVFFSRRIKKQIEEGGIETDGVVSRITDVGGADSIDLRCYVRYTTQEGEEIEGLISNPSRGLEEGQRVRIKYHPKYKMNARIVK